VLEPGLAGKRKRVNVPKEDIRIDISAGLKNHVSASPDAKGIWFPNNPSKMLREQADRARKVGLKRSFNFQMARIVVL
jgi:hypothetical protein